MFDGLRDKLMGITIPMRVRVTAAEELGLEEACNHPDPELYRRYKPLTVTEKDRLLRAFYCGWCEGYESEKNLSTFGWDKFTLIKDR